MVSGSRGSAAHCNHWDSKGNLLHAWAKGKTRKGTEEMTNGNLLSNCKEKQDKVGASGGPHHEPPPQLCLLMVQPQHLLLAGPAR